MTVDIQKVLKQQREMKERSNRFSRVKINRFKPKVGENKIRILPPWTDEGHNAGQFWRELLQHWNVGEGGYQEEGGRIFLCPLRTPDGPGSECDVCDFVQKLRNSDNPADSEVAKEIAPKRTYIMNVVELKDDEYTEADVDEWAENNEGDCPFEVGDTKVKVWSCSEARFKDLVDVMADDIDFTDLESGHDVVVTREGKGRFMTRYRVRVHPSPSSFEFKGDFAALVYDLDTIFSFPRDGDMRKALNGDDTNLPTSEVSSLPKNDRQGEEKSLPEASPPECFKDGETQDDADVQCIGGTDEDGDAFEPCPWLDPCRDHKLSLQKPKKKRAPKRRAGNTQMSEGAEDVEAQLKEALK